MAGLLVKGSAVITLAGAVAGTGSILVPDHVHRHGRARAEVRHHRGDSTPARDRSHGPGGAMATPPAARSPSAAASREETGAGRATGGRAHVDSRRSGRGEKQDHVEASSGQDAGSPTGERGSDGKSGISLAGSSGSRSGSSTSSNDGEPGGSSNPGASIASGGSGDGGSSGSATSGSRTDGSGTDGSNSGTTTSGGQMTPTLTTSSDGGSGSDGGTSGGSGSSGSGDTTTTSGSH